MRMSSRMCFAIAAVGALWMSVVAQGQVGKCCLPDGRGCRNVTQSECAGFGGVFVAGQMCASGDDTCDMIVSGACCVDGDCSITLSVTCGGQFMANMTCDPSPCPSPVMGACCVNGNCTMQNQADCIGMGGGWFEGQLCQSELCHLGACCTGPLSCVVVNNAGCESGTWTRDGTCVALFCASVLGSCCRDDGNCVVTPDFDCTNGTWALNGFCGPTTCMDAVGGCCRGVTCAMVRPGDCAGPNSRFLGVGVACNIPMNHTAPCCKADFNQSGAVSVQDIFDFLGGYFADDASADFNGGGTTVQDIFDFLGAYFTGC